MDVASDVFVAGGGGATMLSPSVLPSSNDLRETTGHRPSSCCSCIASSAVAIDGDRLPNEKSEARERPKLSVLLYIVLSLLSSPLSKP